ncbi:MAG: hypothetical protein ACYSW8_18695 [Planctomycetota bacterium]|jgi:hypothetical protein
MKTVFPTLELTKDPCYSEPHFSTSNINPLSQLYDAPKEPI